MHTLKSIAGTVDGHDTDADVIIVVSPTDAMMPHGAVHPFWECDIATPDLHLVAIDLCLDTAQKFGCGDFTYTIVDRRK